MRTAFYLIGPFVLLALLFSLSPAAEDANTPAEITWKKTVLDKAFRSEGVTVADVNKDGKFDILTGEVWYEAPDWKMHEICPTKDYRKGDQNVYSNSFACWAEDLNGDGYPDLIVIGFPGNPCHWYENPKGKSTHWKKHVIWHSACNETPQYVDLLGTGKRVLLMGWQPITKARWPRALTRPSSGTCTPSACRACTSPSRTTRARWPQDFTSKEEVRLDQGLWEKLLSPQEMKDHQRAQATIPGKTIPGTNRFSHGLGVGDVNADGRLDVICTGGWWEQPAKVDGMTPWKFHPVNLGEACADMYAYDLDGDGKADVISSVRRTAGHLVASSAARQGRHFDVPAPRPVPETRVSDARHGHGRHQRRRAEGPGDWQALVGARPDRGRRSGRPGDASTGSRRRRTRTG